LKTELPESIVIGMQGSLNSTLKVKLVVDAAPEGLRQVVVMVYKPTIAALSDEKV